MTTTYFRPTNAETGAPTLAVYFTAPLCRFSDADRYDIGERIDELVADVRDVLHRGGIPARPTIARGRVRVLQEVSEVEQVANPPEIFATVMAFLTDAEPDDPRLAELAGGFRSERLDGALVEFEIPTEESESELGRILAEEKARGEAFVAVSTAAEAAASPSSSTVPPVDEDDIEGILFD